LNLWYGETQSANPSSQSYKRLYARRYQRKKALIKNLEAKLDELVTRAEAIPKGSHLRKQVELLAENTRERLREIE
jgi:hypothetical protein